MTKKSFNLVEGLIRNWYCEYKSLNYCDKYPYSVSNIDGAFSVNICPGDSSFCSSILIEKVVQIANAACVDFHVTFDDGLVFTLH